MSVYITPSVDAKILGIAHALEKLGTEVKTWDMKQPLFDFIDENNPTVMLLTDEIWESTQAQYARAEFPEIKWVLLQQKAGDHPAEAHLTIQLLDNLPTVEGAIRVPYLADDTLYADGLVEPQVETDIVMISDTYKDDDNWKRWISGWGTEFRFKIFGMVRIPCVYYLGNAYRNQYRHILKSAKIIIMQDKEWFDNALINDTIPLCYTNNSVSEPWEFNTYDDCCEKCRMYLKDRPDWMDTLIPLTYSTPAQKIKERLEI